MEGYDIEGGGEILLFHRGVFLIGGHIRPRREQGQRTGMAATGTKTADGGGCDGDTDCLNHT